MGRRLWVIFNARWFMRITRYAFWVLWITGLLLFGFGSIGTYALAGLGLYLTLRSTQDERRRKIASGEFVEPVGPPGPPLRPIRPTPRPGRPRVRHKDAYR